MHIPVEQISRIRVDGGADSSVYRPASRLSSFGFSGTIAHGAFATRGSTVRDSRLLSAVSRYRDQLAD